MLMQQAEWMDTVITMRPYWFFRTFTGISMDLGMSLLVLTLMKSALARRAG